MKAKVLLVLFLLCAASIAVFHPTFQIKPRVTPRMAVSSQPRIVQNYGTLPLAFEVNQGQADRHVEFISRGRGYTMFLTGTEAVLALRAPGAKSKGGCQRAKGKAEVPPRFALLASGPRSPIPGPQPATDTRTRATDSAAVVRMKLVGANSEATVTGLDELPGKSNYFIGSNPKKWRANVPQFAKVKYQGVYPGIDLVYYGNQGKLEHDFVVSPGANPGAIKLAIEGAEEISVDEGGNLVARVNGGNVVFNKPIAYQNTFINPKSRIENPKSVDGRFVLAANNQVTFEVGSYDKTLPLVIDPVLSYATYLGGSDTDYSFSIAVDSTGNAYVTGGTYSANFPVSTGAYDKTCGTDGSCNANEDVFLTKLNPDGSAILYSTYLGGSSADVAYGVVVDTAGILYLAGTTQSSDFPTTASAFLKTSPGPQPGFVTKLAATGDSLLYSTYLGGSTGELLYALAVDPAGAVYTTGGTVSYDFPTKSALQPSFSGGLACGDFFSGYYDCPDTFVTKLSSDGSSLVYSTYLGRTGMEYGTSIAVDSSGNAYVGGYTTSSDFPTQNPLQATLAGGLDGFVLKVNPAGSALLFSTFLGGAGTEYLQTLVLDSQNNICITGTTSSSDFPTASPFQPSNANPGNFDAFLTKMNSSGSSLLFSTYLGGTGNENGLVITLDPSDNTYIAGVTDSADLPVTDAIQPALGGGRDMFIAKFSSAGGAPVLLTYLGGSADEAWAGGSIAVDSSGSIYVTGETASTDFPVANALQQAYGGGNTDAFVAKISPLNAPGVNLDPESLNFGNQATGITSVAKTSTLTNSGTQPLTIDNITLSIGTEYAESDDCPISPATLAGGAHCTVSVTFTPTTTGAQTDDVVITSDASGSPNMIDLTGSGVPPAPIVSLSSTSLPFADQLVNSTSDPQSVTLTNTGTAALTIISIAKSGDFAQSGNCPISPATLAADASCTITVTFTPTTRGNLTGSIDLTDDAAGSPHSIGLSGTGVSAAGVQLSATTRDFGNQLMGSTSAAQTVTLTNSGDLDLTISSIVAAGDFSRTTTCPVSPTTLAGGANCTMTITFAPTATGVRDSTLTITHNAAGSPHIVTLKGMGTDFAVSIPPGEDSKTVNAGQTAAYGLQLTPTGFSGNVALGCAFQDKTPRGASCSVNPTSVTLSGTDAGPFTVNVSTTARSLAGPRGPALPPSSNPWARRFAPLLLGIMLLMLAVVAVSGRRHLPVSTPARLWAPLAAAMLFVLLWAACGGGGGSPPPPPPSGTPIGTYTLTLTATAGGVSKTSTLTLKVN